jgi:hypothetical protein
MKRGITYSFTIFSLLVFVYLFLSGCGIHGYTYDAHLGPGIDAFGTGKSKGFDYTAGTQLEKLSVNQTARIKSIQGTFSISSPAADSSSMVKMLAFNHQQVHVWLSNGAEKTIEYSISKDGRKIYMDVFPGSLFGSGETYIFKVVNPDELECHEKEKPQLVWRLKREGIFSHYPTQEELQALQGEWPGVLSVRGRNAVKDNHLEFQDNIVTVHWNDEKGRNGTTATRYYISDNGKIVIPFYTYSRIILKRIGNVLTGRWDTSYGMTFRFEKEVSYAKKP